MKCLLAVLLLVPLTASSCLQPPGPKAKLLAVDARELTATTVTADLREPMVQGKNIIWCAAIPLAWNELLDVVGQEIDFLDDLPDPAMLQTLNDRAVTRSVLDEPSYLAMGGLAGDGILERIRQAMNDKFPDVQPNLPDASTARDIIAYAYLFKHLLFPAPFERLDDPLVFAGQEILAFGLSSDSKAPQELLSQISVLDYADPDDFVIELKTRSELDQVILAKVQPQATLHETIVAVLARAATGHGPGFGEGDVLRVPMINIEVTKEFEELANRLFEAPRLGPDPYTIKSAMQKLRLELNEAGVLLRAEATIHSSPFPSIAFPLALIFDRPFLFLMKLRTADQPYFAMWIDNAELLGRPE